MGKNELRAEIRARTAALDSAYLQESNTGILRNLIALPDFIAAKRIFTYLSVGREADTRAIIAYCAEQGKQTALPTDCQAGKMNFALLDRPLSELRPDKFNIPVPGADALRLRPEAGDLILVPALCYDEELFRLGHGGGYYDRYLLDCPAFPVGLCREALVVPRVPRNGFDLPVRCLVTEKRIARP